jgi:hypothetical protein
LVARHKNNRRGSKERRFAAIPHDVLDNPDFLRLPNRARSLLLDVVYQFNGRNNGDLTVAFGFMSKRGWRSKETLSKAVGDLVSAHLIVKTRQGRFQNPGASCDLYALTWKPIDACPGKNLELEPSPTPPRQFSLERFKNPSPETGLSSNQKSRRERQRDERGRYVSYQKSGRSLECT